jgi:hypothetical protein
VAKEGGNEVVVSEDDVFVIFVSFNASGATAATRTHSIICAVSAINGSRAVSLLLMLLLWWRSLGGGA